MSRFSTAGWQKWKAEGRPLESGTQPRRHGHFTASARRRRGRRQGAGARRSAAATTSSTRAPAGRFAGEAPDPRPGVASGHIPGSRNVPQSDFFNADNSWKQGEDLRAVFDAAGVDLAKPMVTTCGSGVTAAVILFGAHLLGKEDVRLYDGSWSEWGADPDTPKATGAAA